MTALARVTARQGRPLYPGRARLVLLSDRRRVLRHGRLALAAWIGLLGLGVGLACGVGITTSELLAEREARLEAEHTAELLSAHADWIACQVVAARQIVMGLPGFGPLEDIADGASEQLTPGMLAWCQGNAGN